MKDKTVWFDGTKTELFRMTARHHVRLLVGLHMCAYMCKYNVHMLKFVLFIFLFLIIGLNCLDVACTTALKEFPSN